MTMLHLSRRTMATQQQQQQQRSLQLTLQWNIITNTKYQQQEQQVIQTTTPKLKQ